MLTRWLYFKVLGLSALFATISFWWQLPGLIGSRGLSPAFRTLDWLRDGHASFAQAPTLVWLSSSDAMLHLLCAGAALGSLLVFASVALRPALALTWVCWLSLVTVGSPFLSFQWDVLLVEVLLFSIPYAPSGLIADGEPSSWSRLLLIIISFKVTFESGVVKLASGDSAWWPDLTALTFHWWSQPLPTWTSYLAWLWPLWAQKLLCLTVLALELVVPLLSFGPRPARRVAGVGSLVLLGGLALGGNYSFYNLLAAALAVPLLDDGFLRRTVFRFLPPFAEVPQPGPARRWSTWSGWALVAVLAVSGALIFLQRFGVQPPAPARQALAFIDPFNCINAYGAFAVMTKTRPEIIVEGSVDGLTWKEYDFRWKPGRLDARPRFVAPWQPRLDWQMWFAALGHCQQNPWLLELQRQLMAGSPQALALLDGDPFSGTRPTRVRTTVYQYRFAPLEQAGQWWTRQPTGPYCPEVRLDAQGALVRATP